MTASSPAPTFTASRRNRLAPSLPPSVPPSLPPLRGLANFGAGFIPAPLPQATEEARQNLNSPGAAAFDGRVATILIVVAMMLTFQHYLLSFNREFVHTMNMLVEWGL